MNKREGRKLTKFIYGSFRNVVYTGKLLLKAYNDEEERIIEGKHDALISEDLFLKVQSILFRKSNKDDFTCRSYNK
jgi:hypothetical protein